MGIQRASAFVVLFIATVFILDYGESLLVPIALSFMLWFLIKAIRDGIKKQLPSKWSLPMWLQNGITFLIITAILGGLAKVLSVNISHMSEVLPIYQKNIQQITDSINQTFNIDLLSVFKEYAQDFDITIILQKILNSLSDVLADAFLILLYVMFLLMEESVFPNKFKGVFQEESKYVKAKQLVKELSGSINEYILLKSLMSLITGTLSYFALLILGVDFAFFWAFLIFLLNYIPTIGSLVAIIFPAAFVLLQKADMGSFFLVLGCIGAIQVLVGNILEPKWMGNNLNISSFVVIIALSFWGSIWGVVGMIISVPITVIMILVLAKFPKTKGIAIMLSGDGKVG
jgi:AI-2 transport protein TqsA